MSIKQYTTPTIQISFTDDDAANILASADAIIVTVSDGEVDIDLTPTIEDNILTCIMTQEQTSQLALGPMYVEATLKFGDKVMKTKTMTTGLDEAVRDRVMS